MCRKPLLKLSHALTHLILTIILYAEYKKQRGYIHNMNKTELEPSGDLIPEFMLLNTILVTKANFSTFTI